MSWTNSSLENLSLVFTDGDWIETKDQSDDGIRLVQTGNVGIGQFKDRVEKARYISEATYTRLKCTEIIPGDCLVSRLPDPPGRACILPDTGEKMITAVDCTIIRFNPDKIWPQFFNYYSQSEEYLKAVAKQCTGATRQRISRKKLGEIFVPLPPIPEQRRIVEILDEAFEEIDAAIANTEKNLVNTRELFPSFFNNIFNERICNARKVTLGESCDFYNGKPHEDSIDSEGRYTLINSKFVSTSGEIYKKTNQQLFPLVKNDIALVMSDVPKGKALAKCYIVREDDKFTLNQRICCIRTNNFDIDFLYYQLNRHPYLLAFDNKGSQANLRKDDILGCPLFIPSMDEQRAIVSILDEMQQFVLSLEDIYQRKLSDLNELKQSLLQKAFRGELTSSADALAEVAA